MLQCGAPCSGFADVDGSGTQFACVCVCGGGLAGYLSDGCQKVSVLARDKVGFCGACFCCTL